MDDEDFKFFGMLRRVECLATADVSKDLTAFVFMVRQFQRMRLNPDDEDTTILRNARNCISLYCISVYCRVSLLYSQCTVYHCTVYRCTVQSAYCISVYCTVSVLYIGVLYSQFTV
jgi:hypothetical protein